MKKLTLIFTISLLFSNVAFAQMIIPEFVSPSKVGQLSSEAEESMPIPFKGGKGFYFFRTYIEGSGSKTKIKGQDIWFSEKKSDQWDSPYRLFRADYLGGNNSIIGTSSDGERVYLYSTTYSKNGEETRKLVYIDNEGRDKWTKAVELKIPNFTFEEKYYSFSINADEDVLLISMSPSESLLDEDLYVSLKGEDGKWGEIIDLGPTINTSKFEVTPFISNDKKNTLFL